MHMQLVTIKLSPRVQKCWVIKMATSTCKWNTAVGSSNSSKTNRSKGKCWRRRSSSSNELTRGSISLWCGYVLIWTTKTGPSCRRFGVLFVESTKLGCVGSKTSPGHGLMVLATIRWAMSLITPIASSTNQPWYICIKIRPKVGMSQSLFSFSFVHTLHNYNQCAQTWRQGFRTYFDVNGKGLFFCAYIA